ncbi:hypothetical protein GCM10023086_09850 [Streptomyces venetus]|uniref:Uncharacterized protein n=1 Tax=Streptomyces venetus TaxID=1701086 RepID=A0ABP8F6J0_9ACTN
MSSDPEGAAPPRSQAMTWSGVMCGCPYETRMSWATWSGVIPSAARSRRAAGALKGGGVGVGVGSLGRGEGRRTRHKLGAWDCGDYGLFGQDHGL